MYIYMYVHHIGLVSHAKESEDQERPLVCSFILSWFISPPGSGTKAVPKGTK
jgi:hypothetical protein